MSDPEGDDPVPNEPLPGTGPEADDGPDDEINNYDQDEDFPEYANDQNKELNMIIQEKI